MKTIKSYTQSFHLAARSIRLGNWIYLIYLLIALLLAIPFSRLFSAATSTNLLGAGLMKEFNATALADILRHDGKSFLVYIKGVWPWMIAFWLMGIFFYGGIINRVAAPRGRFSVRDCFSASVHYFWRFFRLSIYTLLIQAVFLLLAVLLIVLLTKSEGLTDAYFVRTIGIIMAVFLLVFITISLMADMARFKIYRENSPRKVMKSLWKSAGFVIRRLPSVWFLYLLWALLPLALIIAYLTIRPSLEITTVGGVIALFVFQQMFIWLRILFRIQKQGLLFHYYLLRQIAD